MGKGREKRRRRDKKIAKREAPKTTFRAWGTEASELPNKPPGFRVQVFSQAGKPDAEDMD